MRLTRIEHVQLAMPASGEDDARAFYEGVLGLPEKPKPVALARRGGVWFEQGALKVHLGVEPDFRPATKAHPAFIVDDLAMLVERCRDAGYEVIPDEPVPGYERAFVFDPFGNRLEFMEPKPDS